MFRDEWSYCASYVAGDIVTRSEHLWRAKKQSAGKDPANPDNGEYWEDMGVFAPSGPVRHDDTLEKSGTEEAQATDTWGHVGANEAGAIANAHRPSATNPFVTKDQVPELEQKLGAFADIGMPPNIGMIYGGTYDAVSKLVVVVGDGRIAWFDTASVEQVWASQPLEGAWRDITKFGDIFVAVGINCFAHGALGHMVKAALEGNWQSVEAGSAGVLAVADGLTAYSVTGVDGWTVKSVAVGYGEDIAYDAANAVYSIFGRAGRMVGDGDVFTVDSDMPKGTWRAGLIFGGTVVALSGKGAHKVGDGAWQTDAMPEGGWLSVAQGGGYIMGVGDGICAIAKERAFGYTSKAIPNYVFKVVIYGAGRFWAMGSAVLTAGVVNVAEALAAATDANADNAFQTRLDVIALISEAMTMWGGDNV